MNSCISVLSEKDSGDQSHLSASCELLLTVLTSACAFWIATSYLQLPVPTNPAHPVAVY